MPRERRRGSSSRAASRPSFVALAAVVLTTAAGCSSSSTSAPRAAGPDYYPQVPVDSTPPAGDAGPGTPVPGRELLLLGNSEHAAALVVDDTSLFAFLVSSEQGCPARLMKMPKATAGATAQSIWTGAACSVVAMADGGDVVAWVTSDQRSSVITSVPKAGGPPTTVTSVSYRISSIAADANAYYWTFPGTPPPARPVLLCGTDGFVASRVRAASTDTTLAPSEVCADVVHVESGVVYWFSTPLAGTDISALLTRSTPSGASTPTTLSSLPADAPNPAFMADGFAYWLGSVTAVLHKVSLSSGAQPQDVTTFASTPNSRIVTRLVIGGGQVAFSGELFESGYWEREGSAKGNADQGASAS